MLEGIFSDQPVADVVVSVDSGIEIRLRVVQVECEHLIQPDHFFHLSDCGVPALGFADVVTSGKKMRRVEADPQPLRLFHFFKNISQVPDLVAKASALTGGVFQRDPNRRFFRGPKNLVQRLGNAFDTGLLALTKVRSGMQHEKRHAECGGKLDLLRERLH